MAENVVLMFHFFTLILAGLTSPLQHPAVTPSCQGLQSKHEFSNFSVGQRYASGTHICVLRYEHNDSVIVDIHCMIVPPSLVRYIKVQFAKHWGLP